jgi:hypothetical protein
MAGNILRALHLGQNGGTVLENLSRILSELRDPEKLQHYFDIFFKSTPNFEFPENFIAHANAGEYDQEKINALNTQVAELTNGKLKGHLQPSDLDVLKQGNTDYLMNLVMNFDGFYTKFFNTREEGDFTLANGQTIKCSFLTDTSPRSVFMNEEKTRIKIPLYSKNYTTQEQGETFIHFLKPTDRKTIPSFENWPTLDKEKTDINFQMPASSITTGRLDLNPALREIMGIPSRDTIFQSCTVGFSEKGVSGASQTTFASVKSSLIFPQVPLYPLDSPFGFTITHKGFVILQGIVTDPTLSEYTPEA